MCHFRSILAGYWNRLVVITAYSSIHVLVFSILYFLAMGRGLGIGLLTMILAAGALVALPGGSRAEGRVVSPREFLSRAARNLAYWVLSPLANRWMPPNLVSVLAVVSASAGVFCGRSIDRPACFVSGLSIAIMLDFYDGILARHQQRFSRYDKRCDLLVELIVASYIVSLVSTSLLVGVLVVMGLVSNILQASGRLKIQNRSLLRLYGLVYFTFPFFREPIPAFTLILGSPLMSIAIGLLNQKAGGEYS